MNLNDWVGLGLTIISLLGGLFAWVETRSEKRVKSMKEDVLLIIETKIAEYANRVQSERLNSLERENERLKEYSRDKK